MLAMLVVILAYDQLLFRPIVAWADKFRFEQTAAPQRPRSWVYDLWRRGTAGAPRRRRPSAGWPRAYRGCRSASPARRAAARTAGASRAASTALWLAVVLAAVAYAAVAHRRCSSHGIARRRAIC